MGTNGLPWAVDNGGGGDRKGSVYMEERRHVGTLCICPINGALKRTWLYKKDPNYNIN